MEYEKKIEVHRTRHEGKARQVGSLLEFEESSKAALLAASVRHVTSDGHRPAAPDDAVAEGRLSAI